MPIEVKPDISIHKDIKWKTIAGIAVLLVLGTLCWGLFLIPDNMYIYQFGQQEVKVQALVFTVEMKETNNLHLMYYDVEYKRHFIKDELWAEENKWDREWIPLDIWKKSFK